MPIGNLGRDKAMDGIQGSYYLSLHTSTSPTDSNEVSASGYTRQAIRMSTRSSDNHSINAAIPDVTASSSWGTLRGFRLVRSSSGNMDESGSAENILFSGPMASLTVNNGDTFRVELGAIDLYIA